MNFASHLRKQLQLAPAGGGGSHRGLPRRNTCSPHQACGPVIRTSRAELTAISDPRPDPHQRWLQRATSCVVRFWRTQRVCEGSGVSVCIQPERVLNRRRSWSLFTAIGTLNTTFEIENVNVNVEFFLHTLIFPHFRSASAFAKHF